MFDLFISFIQRALVITSVCYQRFCCKLEFAVIKKLDISTDTFEHFFYKSYILCIYKNRIGEAILTNTQNVCFPEE